MLLASIPESIRVNMAELQIEQAINDRGFEAARRGESKRRSRIDRRAGDQKIEEEATPIAAPTAEQAEPEVIGRVKEAEGEEEENEKK